MKRVQGHEQRDQGGEPEITRHSRAQAVEEDAHGKRGEANHPAHRHRRSGSGAAHERDHLPRKNCDVFGGWRRGSGRGSGEDLFRQFESSERHLVPVLRQVIDGSICSLKNLSFTRNQCSGSTEASEDLLVRFVEKIDSGSERSAGRPGPVGEDGLVAVF